MIKIIVASCFLLLGFSALFFIEIFDFNSSLIFIPLGIGCVLIGKTIIEFDNKEKKTFLSLEEELSKISNCEKIKLKFNDLKITSKTTENIIENVDPSIFSHSSVKHYRTAPKKTYEYKTTITYYNKRINYLFMICVDKDETTTLFLLDSDKEMAIYYDRKNPNKHLFYLPSLYS